MTQKELLYMEDAIGHETNLATICEIISQTIEDKNLKIFVKKLAKKHENLKTKLINVMEDTLNE